MTATRHAVLALEVERFRYSGAEHDTLAGICLTLAPGSLMAIVGDSGSGKSTLGAVLAGMLPRHDGDDLEACITLDGQEIRHGAGSDPRIDPVGWARHVGMLPQDARHYLSGVRETVEEELALGLENAGVPRADMRLSIAALARKLGIGSLLPRDSGKLSGGQERLVALAALALGAAPVLVLDEPLAGLDASAAAQVSALLGHLRSEGTALVLLTRSLDGLAAGADRVLSLRADAAGSVPAPPPAHRNPRAGAAVLLEFAGTELGYAGSADPVVAGLDLQVRAGECIALAGPNGAGKTTVLKAAAGLLRPRAGRVVDHARPGGSIGLLLQNPSDQLFERTVRREVAFGLPKRGPQAARVPEVLATLGLAAEAETHPYELPASARRLVALATVLVRDPKVLLLDEPTEALDAEGMARLQGAIGKVLDRGGAVLFSTHDEAFTAATAHRVHRMEPARSARA